MECNTDYKYDVVVGSVANDTVGLLIRRFSRGTINAEYLRKKFDFGTLTNQYTFHTVKALNYLRRVGVAMTNEQQEMMEYTTQEIIQYIIEDNRLGMTDAMDRYYMSKTFEQLADVETGLYLQGSAYVYERYKAEQNQQV